MCSPLNMHFMTEEQKLPLRGANLHQTDLIPPVVSKSSNKRCLKYI